MNREHWIQGLAIVVPLVAALVVTLGGGIWALSGAITSVRVDNTVALSTLTARLAADEEKITSIEKLAESHYLEELAFRTEMRAALSRATDLLSDVRVSVGHLSSVSSKR